ncbi:MAG: DUF4397 domain-containing protein [Gammaproteobacteria bacterium]
MRKILWVPLLLGLTALIGACGGDSNSSDGSEPDEGSGTPNRYYFRLVHALPDGPPLFLQDDGVSITGGIDYHGASVVDSRALGGTSDSIEFTVDGRGPDQEVIPDILASEVPIEGNTEYTFVATGQYDAPALLAVPNPRRDRPLDGLFFQFVHAASSAGTVDVYVTSPDVALSATAPVARLAPGEFTESLPLAYQNQRVRLASPGTLDVVFDSGRLDFADDPNRDDDGIEWLIVVADSLLPGSSPVKLIAADNRGTRQILQAGAAAGLRAFHASRVFPDVDVVVGDGFEAPLAQGLQFRQRSSQVAVPAGRVSINVTPAGDPSTFFFEDTISTSPGASYQLFLAESDDGSPASFRLGGEPRSVSTESWLRFVNAAAESDFFSVYIGETADDPPNEDDRRIRDLRYGEFVDYLRLAPGTYEVTLTERFYQAEDDPADAEETITIGPFAFEALPGGVKTLVILPPTTEGGPETLEVFDDLAP